MQITKPDGFLGFKEPQRSFYGLSQDQYYDLLSQATHKDLKASDNEVYAQLTSEYIKVKMVSEAQKYV